MRLPGVAKGLLLVALAPAALGIWALRERDGDSLLPHLLLLGASPLVALAAALATGGVRHVRSGEIQRPTRLRDGWFTVEPFRAWLALRNAAAAALVVFAAFGGFAFVDYFATTTAPAPLAALLLLGWLALLARLAWAVLKRSWVGRALADARLQTRPAVPRAGAPFRIRLQQAARRSLQLRAVEATLVCERLLPRVTKAGRTRSSQTVVWRERAVIAPETLLAEAEEIRAEHAFQVPSQVLPEGGFLSWRLELRTRLLGPDYRTHFPLAQEQEEDEP